MTVIGQHGVQGRPSMSAPEVTGSEVLLTGEDVCAGHNQPVSMSPADFSMSHYCKQDHTIHLKGTDIKIFVTSGLMMSF